MIHTQYEQLSDEQLADLFHSSNWNQMNGSQRLAACQEVANRDALAHGMEPREVVADDLRGLDFGAYDPAQGCCGSVYLLTQDPAFSHRVQTAGGYLREEAERQLKAFFENRRSKQS